MDQLLRISDAANLGIHAMAHIALAGAEVNHSVAEIGAAQGVSEAHLSKVMQKLVRAGLVESRRGPGGGFALGRPAPEITLLQIYEAIEGPIGEANCLLGRQQCLFGGCALGGMLHQVHRQIRDFLASRRLSEIAASPAAPCPTQPCRGGSTKPTTERKRQ